MGKKSNIKITTVYSCSMQVLVKMVLIHNADIFGIDFDRIDGVILNHGHFDHFTGLANILRKYRDNSSALQFGCIYLPKLRTYGRYVTIFLDDFPSFANNKEM